MARGDGDSITDARCEGERRAVGGEAELVRVERRGLPAGSGGEDLGDGDLEGRGLRRRSFVASSPRLRFLSRLNGVDATQDRRAACEMYIFSRRLVPGTRA